MNLLEIGMKIKDIKGAYLQHCAADYASEDWFDCPYDRLSREDKTKIIEMDLSDAFSWGDSGEGVHFWNDVYSGKYFSASSYHASTTHTNEGKKDDGGKPPVFSGCFQYFPRALKEVAKVSGYGAEKYDLDFDDKNFLRVEDARRRYTDAMGRHFLDESAVGVLDESGQRNDAMVAWNALARLEVALIEQEKDGDE